MSSSWKKIENENGYPIYVNETTNTRQWDHPKFVDIKQTLDECNFIKFSSYRVASKIRILQRALFFDEISITSIIGIFEKHQLGSNEATVHLESYDLEAILSDIYFAANKQNHMNTDIDFATELMQNFLYNVFDKDRKGLLQVVSTKIALGLLSFAKLSEFYRYIYSVCADYNNSVTRFRLQKILTRFTSIIEFLHEDIYFGPQLVQTTLDECFVNCPGAVGLTEMDFMSWLETGPVVFTYIPTLYRMRTAESVVHNAKCSVCKVTPFMGLKYRCLKCTRYTQCQKCFLTARISQSHKAGHPMREYCAEKCSREFTQAFIKRLCGLLRCSLKLQKHPLDFIEPRAFRTDSEYLLKMSEVNSECNVTPLSCPQVQLQVIIRQLELQNKELQTHVAKMNNRNDKEIKRYLEEHRLHIAVQIQKLKLLKDYLQNLQKSEVNHLESTPMTKYHKSSVRNTNLDIFSPITRAPDFSTIPETSTDNFRSTTRESTVPLSIRDISTWIGERPATAASSATLSTYVPSSSTQTESKVHVKEMQHDLDAVLDKLQQILANNFTLDDSLSSADNDQLQEAVSEMEGMLTSLIDGVENSRANSALTSFPIDKETLLF